MAQLLVWSGVYSFIANILIGELVLIRNPKDKTNRLFMLFSLMVGSWSIGSTFENIIGNPAIALNMLRLNYVFGVWLPPVYLQFINSFLPGSHRSVLLKPGYIISAVLTPFLLTPYFIPGLRLMAPYHYYISRPGPIYYVFFVFFSVFMLEILRLSFSALRLQHHPYRHTFLYIAFANLLAIFAGFEYFSRVFGFLNSPPLDDFILIAYVLVLAFAIARHRLFDADALVDLFRKERLAAIGLIAASINHEIKNPLYAIKNSIDTSLDRIKAGGPLDSEILKRAGDQADRIFNIIQSINRFVKPASLHVKDQKASLESALSAVMDFIYPEIKLKGIKVLKEIPPGFPTLSCSQYDLESLLFNLIMNACQCLSTDGVIKVTAHEMNGSLRIEISDNGPGIDSEIQPQIFEPFFTSGKEDGKGLGLYIAKRLIERYKGKIRLESEKGKGTKFILEFKAASQAIR